MSDIDDFIKSEEQKMSWFDRLVNNYPKVRPTSFICHSLQNNRLPEQTIIKPSIWDRMVAMIITFFLAIAWIGILRMVLAYQFPFAIILFGFLFVTFLIILVIRNTFLNKKYIYTLIFDQGGISIDHRKILWNDISGTYIMNRQEGRWTNYYLILVKKDKTVEKLDLFRMGIYDRKLATIIEYYRQRAL